MRQVPKFFNTAGPIQPDIHYNIDPLTRIDLEELESLIYQRKYFVLHAPRQTGKTSCLLALRDYLNTRGEFYAVYANVEVGQASRNNVEEVNRNVVSVIAREASRVVGTGMPSALRLELEKEEAASNLLGSYLDRLCESLDRPLLLFIDEIDALVGDSLVSILRQLRSGYANRPGHFPQSIICAVSVMFVITVSYFRIRTSLRAVRRSTSKRNPSAWAISPVKRSVRSTCNIPPLRARNSTNPVFR